MNTLETIKQYAVQEFEVKSEEIDVDAPFEQVGIDSLGLVEFIFELEDKFDIRLDASKADGLKTLRDLANHIDELITQKATCAESS